MGRGLHIPLVGGQNTMGKWVFIPWIGGQNTMGRGRYNMGRGVKIPWMGRGDKIPWIGGSKYHGGGQNTMMGVDISWGGGQNTMGSGV